MKQKIKNFFTLNRRANGGFTLVELVVVIAILAILAGVAVPAYSGYINKANEAADQQLLAALNTAYAAACMENGEYDMKNLSFGTPTAAITDGVATVNAECNEAFQKYFGEGNKFKYYTKLVWDENECVFKHPVVDLKAMAQTLNNAWNGSSFGGDGGKDVAQMLLGTMDSIDGLLDRTPFSKLFEGAPADLVAALGFADMAEGIDGTGVMHFAEDAKNHTAQEVLNGATGLLNLLNLKDNEDYLSRVDDQALIDTYFSTLEDGDATVFGDNVTWKDMTREQKIKAAKDNLGLEYGDLKLSAEEVVVLTTVAGMEIDGLSNAAGVSGVGGMYALAAGFYNSDYGKDSATRPNGENVAQSYGEFGTVLNAMEDPKWNEYLEKQALKDMEAYVSFMGYLSEGEFGEDTTFSEDGYKWIADALGMK